MSGYLQALSSEERRQLRLAAHRLDMDSPELVRALIRRFLATEEYARTHPVECAVLRGAL